LLDLGVLPVINENDTVVTDEIRFGDNDTLGALVSNLIEADVLVILTDQEGVYDADPRENSDAKLIQESDANNLELLNFASSKGSLLGSGGMTTKITAAQRAARSGTHTIICSGSQLDILKRVEQGEQVGTMLTATSEPLQAKKQWLANQLKSKGKVFVDAGAAKVLTQKNKSLLGVGVTKIEGNFNRGELVSCIDPDGCEIAKGLINYDAQQSNKIKGLSSEKIEAVLGFVDEPELINRDNLVIISK
jgi:glutamate 5-kinase